MPGRGDEVLTLQGTETPAGGAIDGAREQGVLLLPALYAEAMPRGSIVAQAYADLLSQLLQEIERAKPVHGILLLLHGAVVIEGIDDGEGDLLQELAGQLGVGSAPPSEHVTSEHRRSQLDTQERDR